MRSNEQVFGRAWEYGGGGRKSAAEIWRDYGKGPVREERLAQVRFIARLMDDRFAIRGTNIRFGLDFLLGLFPGLGDAVTSVISLFIVHHAWQSGASKLTLLRMSPMSGSTFSSAQSRSPAICSMWCGRRTARTRASSRRI